MVVIDKKFEASASTRDVPPFAFSGDRDIVLRKPIHRQIGVLRSLLKKAGINKPIHLQEFLVAVLGGEVLGCAGTQIVGSYAILHSVTVRKDWRRRGIGKLLIWECVDAARKRGITHLALTTMFWNVNFFRRCGFQTTSRKQFPKNLQQHTFFSAPKYRYTIPMVMALSETDR